MHAKWRDAGLRARAILTGAWALACLALLSPASAHAQTTAMERYTESFSYIFEDPCLVGEPVLITGTTHIGIKNGTNENGTRGVSLNPGTTHAVGVGQVTGDTYIFIAAGGGAVVNQYEADSWVGDVHTLTGGTRFIRLGPETDSGQWVFNHGTTNANGDVPSEFFRATTECPPQ